MKTRVIACMVSFAFLLAAPSALAQADKLIGVWKLVELKTPAIPELNLEARTVTSSTRIHIFTKKHFMLVSVRGENPRPVLPENPTDAQLMEAWRPFNGSAGTYEVKDSTITSHILVHKDPNVMREQETVTSDFRFEGDVLIVRSSPPNMPGVYEVKYTRLE